METFAAALKTYRLALGWSLETLAARSGADISLCSRLETGHRNPTPDNLAKLCAGLGLPGKDRDRLWLLAGFVPPDVPTAALAALIAAYRVAARAGAETTEEAA